MRSRMYNLLDKTIIITGASRGIGKETALKFAAEKSKLVITYARDKKQAQQVADKCLALGSPDVFISQLDLAQLSSIRSFVAACKKHRSNTSFLINNAGIGVRKKFTDHTDDEIQQLININLLGLIRLTKECIPILEDGIVNISSGAGKSGIAELSVYCASKFGVRGFTQSIAKEFPRLRVYSVNPGMTATDMTDFQGLPADNVAQVIVDTVKGKYTNLKKQDIDVWKLI